MDQIRSLLNQYVNGDATAPASDVKDHYDQVAQTAPQEQVATGIAQAIQSNQTPDFSQIVSHLFGQANGQQKAGILNTLISTVGPMVASRVLGQSGGGLSGLAGLLGGGQQQVTPDQAAQVPPQSAGQLASEAHSQDPSVVSEVSSFLAGHPDLVKNLDSSTVATVLQKIGLNL